MIGYLKGTVLRKTVTHLILVVHGVGYEIAAPTRVTETLTQDTEVEIFIYTHVKEDQLKLFGFDTIQERDLFELLISISGIGPKAAMSILSLHTHQQINNAIAKADVAFFSKVKGLGKKRAQKIIIELKGKIGSFQDIDLTDSDSQSDSAVVDVLISFGFKRKEIEEVLHKLDPTLSEEKIIKEALRMLGKT